MTIYRQVTYGINRSTHAIQIEWVVVAISHDSDPACYPIILWFQLTKLPTTMNDCLQVPLPALPTCTPGLSSV